MNKTDPRTTQQLLDWLDAMPDGHYLNECNRFGAIRARLVAAEQMAKALEVLEAIANAYDQIDEKRKKCFVDEGRPSPPPYADHHRVSISIGECRTGRAALGAWHEITK